MTRYVHIGSRLTVRGGLSGRLVSKLHRAQGWNAIKSRVEQLGLELTDDQVKEITSCIKNLGDAKQQSIEDVDSLLRKYHRHIATGELQVGGIVFCLESDRRTDSWATRARWTSSSTTTLEHPPRRPPRPRRTASMASTATAQRPTASTGTRCACVFIR
jgi:hypothetical protein